MFLVELVERHARDLDLALDALFARLATAHALESIRKAPLGLRRLLTLVHE
jgi:hypothetical protein